jgi:hypothetical protein
MPNALSRALASEADRPAGRHHVAWIGGAAGLELAWAHRATRQLAPVSDLDRPLTPWSGPPAADAAARRAAAPIPAFGPAPHVEPTTATAPTVAVLATDAPGRWHVHDCVALARRWPLAVIVAATTSLSDGRRRSGPVLPGIEDVSWNELPARLAIWLADLAAGLPGTLGLPATTRREDRVLEMCAAATRARGRGASGVAVAAPDRTALEGLGDLLAAVGHAVTARSVGRPPIDDPTDTVVWEVADVDQATLVWLRLLADARPGRQVVLVTGFPRGDSAVAALQAGAQAILGQPVCLEALAGALQRPHRPRDIDLGFAPQSH